VLLILFSNGFYAAQMRARSVADATLRPTLKVTRTAERSQWKDPDAFTEFTIRLPRH